MVLGPELDARRSRVVSEDRMGAAIASLTPLVRVLPVEALTPVKQLLKRFFSAQPWTEAEDDALADAVGPQPDAADPTGRAELAPDLALVWEWVDHRFRLRLVGPDASADD